MRKQIRIGTRGSALALWQAEWVKSELGKRYPNLVVTITTIKTAGDKTLDVPLATVGGKGLFVKEIEEAILSDKIDIAVHSMKDVPTALPAGLHLAAITKREDPRDALLARDNMLFNDLPKGAKIGTSSLRRQSQLLSARPDLVIHQIRGNVDTRLRKLKEGQFDALVLAAAGLKRLGLDKHITDYFHPEICLPAIGQGALGIECRTDDQELNDDIEFLNNPNTRTCVLAERAFLQKLEGDCQVPIACYGQISSGELHLTGLVSSVDGKRRIQASVDGDPNTAERLGVLLAENLLSRGADLILRDVSDSHPNFFCEAKPLFGTRIVVTRSRDQAGEFAAMLIDRGATVFEFPTIEVVPPSNWAELDSALNAIEPYGWIFFTSVNAVKFFMQRFQHLGHDLRMLKKMKCCSIGPRTAETLGQYGLTADVVAAEFTAEGVIAALDGVSLKGLSALIPRAKEARELLPDTLRGLGAQVTVVPVYEKIKPDADLTRLKTFFSDKRMLAITFTSASTVRNFVEIVGQKEYKSLLNDVTIACIGPITAKTIEEYGMTIDIMPKEYTIPSLVDALANYYTQNAGTKQVKPNSRAKPPATPGRIEKAML